MRHMPLIGVLLSVSVIFACVSTTLAQTCLELRPDTAWTDLFPAPGIQGTVTSSAFYQGEAYIGGTFISVDEMLVNGIARWDGTSWREVGTNGPPYGATQLVVHEGSLYAVNLDPAHPFGELALYEWDGASWTHHPALPLTYGGRMKASAVSWNGDIYVGGSFIPDASVGTSEGVLRWDGVAWSMVGATTGEVWDLVVHDDKVVATFSGGSIDGVSTDGTARYGGSSWTKMGNLSVTQELTVHDGDLYVERILSSSSTEVRRWNGGGWTLVQSYAGRIYGIHGSTLGLVVNGSFAAPHPGITIWDGVSWLPLGGGTPDDVGEPVSFLDTPWGLLYTGDFSEVDGVYTRGAALWNGMAWASPGLSPGNGLRGAVYSLGPWNGDLIAGGNFLVERDHSIQDLARWDGTQWHSMHGAEITVDYVSAIAEYQGNLIAGGSFDIGGVEYGVVAFDGLTWSAVGALAPPVSALEVWDGKLAAGGSFDDGVLRYLALWDGLAWSTPGGGIPVGLDVSVRALHDWSGLLVVGGNQAQTGTVSGPLAGWNGSDWVQLGNLLGPGDGEVRAITDFQGDLVIGGTFDLAPNFARIARLQGSVWTAMGDGFPGVYSGAVQDLVAYGGTLYAAGYPGVGAPVPSERVLAWDGSCWAPLGSGVAGPNASVRAMTEHDGVLYMGGSFQSAGGLGSFDVAGWTALDVVSVGNGPRVTSFFLSPAAPNPTAFAATAFLDLRAEEHVTAEVISIDGRRVASLVDRRFPTGRHEIVWNGRDEFGRDVSTGVYFLHVRSGGKAATRKIVRVE